MGRKNRRADEDGEARRGKRRSIRLEGSEGSPTSRGTPARSDAPPAIHLRRLTAAEALARLEQAVRGYGRLGRPELLIVHGRGLRSPAGEPVIGPLVRRWCDEHSDLVVSWRPAPPAWGGEGAIVVQLRHQPPR